MVWAGKVILKNTLFPNKLLIRLKKIKKGMIRRTPECRQFHELLPLGVHVKKYFPGREKRNQLERSLLGGGERISAVYMRPVQGAGDSRGENDFRGRVK